MTIREWVDGFVFAGRCRTALQLGLLIAVSGAACDEHERGASAAIDASATHADSASNGEDAGAHDGGAPASAVLHSAVVELLTRFDRQAAARCRCLVMNGDFASLEQCLDKTGGELRFADCFSMVLAPMDSDDLRAQLQCLADEFAQRGTCLEAASCADDEIVPCLSRNLGCPMFDPQTLTQLLSKCPGAAMLGR